MKKSILFTFIFVLIFNFTSASAIESRLGLSFYPIGDVNADGCLNIRDATLIQRHLVGILTDCSFVKGNADINGDGNVDIEDVTQIRKNLLTNLHYRYPDNNKYISSKMSINLNTAISESKIIDCDKILDASAQDIHFIGMEHNKIALLTTKDEFLSCMNFYCSEFDEEFFEKNALVVYNGYTEHPSLKYCFPHIAVENNTLFIETEKCRSNDPYRETDSPFEIIPEERYLIYKVNKSDIDNVNNIICTSNFTISE